jgi:hypothetical protein
MAGFHGFPNRLGKKQFSKIGVKTKVSSDCFFTENEPNQVWRKPHRPFGKRLNPVNPMPTLAIISKEGTANGTGSPGRNSKRCHRVVRLRFSLRSNSSWLAEP